MLGFIDRIRYPRGHYTRRTNLAPVTADTIASVETVAKAAEEIHARYGIKTAAEVYRAVIMAANHRNQLVEAFKEQDFKVLDTADVLEYKERSKKPSLWQRFKTGARIIHNEITSNVLHSTSWGYAAAWAGLLLVVPILLPLLVNVFLYEVDFLLTYGVTLIPIGMVIFIIIVGYATDNDVDVDEAATFMGRIYACITYGMVIFPLQLLITLSTAWLARPETGREWRLLDVPSFIGDKVMPDDIVLAMHSAHQIVPDAKLQIEAMYEHGEATEEAFLALDLDGVNSEKVYLWYSPRKA